jgi:hypothetical protein
MTLPQQPNSSSSSSSSASTKRAAAEQQPQQQSNVGLGRLLQLPRSTLVQLAVLCYSHAVMGYCFFILQVSQSPNQLTGMRESGCLPGCCC